MSPFDLLFVSLLALLLWPAVWGTGVVWFARGWFDRRTTEERSSVALSVGAALLWELFTGAAALPALCVVAPLADGLAQMSDGLGAPRWAGGTVLIAVWLAIVHLIATLGAAVLLPHRSIKTTAKVWAVCWAAAGAWVAGSAAVCLPLLKRWVDVMASC